MDAPTLVARLRSGDRRALARLLTWIEDGPPARVRDVVTLLRPASPSAHVVGITGAPGVGKSTLVNALTGTWRGGGRRVAVLAVDPSSPYTGGALLGDRIRLQDHALDDGVYVRSMATRGHLGGLSAAAPLALLALDAAGFDVVLVETVGVGQAEVEIASVADTTVVLIAPGLGDAVQAAKAGILEVADVLCVSKADRRGAQRVAADLREMLQLAPGDGPAPAIRLTSAQTGAGVDELAAAIDGHARELSRSGALADRRRRRARLQIETIALDRARSDLAGAGDDALLDRLATAVASGRSDPFTAADRLLAARFAPSATRSSRRSTG